MRLLSALILVGLVAGCGGDDSEPAQEEAPAQVQRIPPVQQPVDSGPQPAQLGGAVQPDTGQTPVQQPTQPLARGGLFAVQVAAFLDAGTARELVGRLQGEGLPAWVSETRVAGRVFHRVRVGAASSVAAAHRLGGLVRSRVGGSYWVAPLSPGERVPVGAVDDTRRVLQNG